jgi:hypothetical protein
MTTTPSPLTGGDAVVVVGCVVLVELVVVETEVVVLVVGIDVVDVVVDGTPIEVVVVVSPGNALELEASAIGTTNATTAMNTVAPELMR